MLLVVRDVMVEMVILVQTAVRDQRVSPDHQEQQAHQDPQEQLDMALLDQRYRATMWHLKC